MTRYQLGFVASELELGFLNEFAVFWTGVVVSCGVGQGWQGGLQIWSDRPNRTNLGFFKIRNQYILARVHRMARFGPKVGQIGLKWDKSWTL